VQHFHNAENTDTRYGVNGMVCLRQDMPCLLGLIQAQQMKRLMIQWFVGALDTPEIGDMRVSV
jgi:hypothetical protein